MPINSLPDDDSTSLTIQQFCDGEDISRASYHKIQRLGYGPEVLRVAGTTIVRITAKARREWHKRMAELAQQEDGRIERQRRVELASEAGKAAARSPLHVSRRGPRNRASRNS